jgi:cytochrome c-type biogenesis protein
MEPASLIAAFLAGPLPFVSPRVLPLIPGYISFISSVTLEDMRAGDTRRRLDAGARQ